MILKKLDWHKVILYGGIIILAILLFKKCKKPIEKPVYIPIEKQVKVVEKDEKAMKKQADSFLTIIKIQDRTNEENYNDVVLFANENSELKTKLDQLSKTAPDTCKRYVDQYISYAAQTEKTLGRYSRAVDGLKTTVSTQKKFLSAKDSAYARLKTNWDTCIATAKRLEDYAKQIKPKRELNVGVNGMATYAGDFRPALGITLGYRNRKGFEINAGVYSNQLITVGIKRPILRF